MLQRSSVRDLTDASDMVSQTMRISSCHFNETVNGSCLFLARSATPPRYRTVRDISSPCLYIEYTGPPVSPPITISLGFLLPVKVQPLRGFKRASQL